MVGKPESDECDQVLQIMLLTCRKLGFLIVEGKIEGPTAVIIFLGTILDTIKMELRLPRDKLEGLLP